MLDKRRKTFTWSPFSGISAGASEYLLHVLCLIFFFLNSLNMTVCHWIL